MALVGNSMNPSLLSTLPQPNSDNILSGSTQQAFQQSKDIASKLANPSQASSVLSSVNDLNHQPASPIALSGDSQPWWQKLLPTALSIGGGLLGTLADPFTMGAGTFIGAGAGDALGKSIQNGMAGKDTTLQDLGGAALEGAGGQLLGAGIGKAVGGIGKVIGGVGEKGLAQEATANTAQAALDHAQATRNAFGDVSKYLKEGVNPEQSLKGAQDLATRVGVNNVNPSEMLNAAKNGVDALGNVRSNILSKVTNIPTAGVVDASGNKVAPSISDMINSSLHNTHPITGEQVGVDRTGVLGSIEPVFGGKGKLVLPNNASTAFQTEASNILNSVINKPNVSALDLQNAQSLVGQKANDIAKAAATAQGTDAIKLKEQAGAWQDLNNHLKGMFNHPEIDSGVSGMTGNLTAKDVGGNQALADELNSRITGAQTNQDLNTSLSHFLNMRDIAKGAVSAGNNTSSAAAVRAAKEALPVTEGGLAAAPGNVLANTVGATNHPVAKLLGGVLNIGSKGGAAGHATSNLGSLLQRISKVAGPVAGETITNSPNYVSAAGANTAIGQNMQPQGIGVSGNATQDILNSNSPVALPLQELLRLHQNGGGYNVPSEMGTIAPLAQQSLNQMTSANSAQSQLDELIKLYNAAGGAQGPIGGLLSKLGASFTGGAAASYQPQADQIAKQISQLTGTNINAPSLMQDQGTANSVLQQLQQALSSYGGAGGSSSL